MRRPWRWFRSRVEALSQIPLLPVLGPNGGGCDMPQTRIGLILHPPEWQSPDD